MVSFLGKQQSPEAKVQSRQSKSTPLAQSASQIVSDAFKQQPSAMARHSTLQVVSFGEQKEQYMLSVVLFHSLFMHTFLFMVSHSPSAQTIVQSLSAEEQ